jgi:hypothetical protein
MLADVAFSVSTNDPEILDFYQIIQVLEVRHVLVEVEPHLERLISMFKHHVTSFVQQFYSLSRLKNN